MRGESTTSKRRQGTRIKTNAKAYTLLCSQRRVWRLAMVAVLMFPAWGVASPAGADDPLVLLGAQLFSDTSLSFTRTQSCASCHNPEHAFIDTRFNPVGNAASLGADGVSLGDRHAPTLSYSAYSPDKYQPEPGVTAGGQFWDGRVDSLEQQVLLPLLNPLEMALPDVQVLKARLLENNAYQHAFRTLFADDVFDTNEALSAAFSSAMAAFLRTEYFSPFDSRYDRYLRGELQPTLQETIGMGLFFNNAFTNCSHCHQLNTLPRSSGETFSNYRYENIGLPANYSLRQHNGKGADFVDAGFMQQGRFKVPGLRNVAVTAPYMHNGIFQQLRTVLLFYNKYNTSGGSSQLNPETGQAWGEPELDAHRDMVKLTAGIPLTTLHMDALEAFLRMLTDQRYEHLLP